MKNAIRCYAYSVKSTSVPYAEKYSVMIVIIFVLYAAIRSVKSIWENVVFANAVQKANILNLLNALQDMLPAPTVLLHVMIAEKSYACPVNSAVAQHAVKSFVLIVLPFVRHAARSIAVNIKIAVPG